MSVNLKYDIYTNCGTAKKIKGITDYYIGVTKICPICNKAIIGHPALRRKDNKTQICSNCSTIEALQVFRNYKKQNKNIKET